MCIVLLEMLAGDTKPYILSVSLAIGDVLLMSNYDDVCPKVIHTGLGGECNFDNNLEKLRKSFRLNKSVFRCCIAFMATNMISLPSRSM